jgi:hypothetical protein
MLFLPVVAGGGMQGPSTADDWLTTVNAPAAAPAVAAAAADSAELSSQAKAAAEYCEPEFTGKSSSSSRVLQSNLHQTQNGVPRTACRLQIMLLKITPLCCRPAFLLHRAAITLRYDVAFIWTTARFFPIVAGILLRHQFLALAFKTQCAASLADNI